MRFQGCRMGDRSAQSGSGLTSYSVVMPAYNSAATIGRAIESVIDQTFTDWRLVVVDDGSGDSTAEVAQRYAETDRRITVIRQRNVGPGAARNAGFGVDGSADLVAFLDSDDEFRPEYLDEMDKFIRAHPEHDVYHPNLRVIAASGSVTRFSSQDESISFGLEDLLRGCVIAVGGAVIRLDLLRRLGGFQEDIHCEDYDFWLRAFSHGARSLYLPLELYVYHQESSGRRSQDTRAGARDSVVAIERLLSRGLIPNQLVPLAHDVIAAKGRRITEIDRERELTAQANRFYGWLEETLGPRGAKLAGRLVDLLKGLVVPLRRMLVRRRMAKRPGSPPGDS